MGKDHEARQLLRIFGYDPDDPVPRNADGHRVIPDRLIDALAEAPYVNPRHIWRIDYMSTARNIAAIRDGRARKLWKYAYRPHRGA